MDYSNKKIVVIGGGTGSFTVLKGLKQFTDNITSIISMMDDGGSTGRLRDEYGILPPGDVRQALVALSHRTHLLKRLFQYRFSNGKALLGHNLGNLMLMALGNILGDDAEAIKEAGKILNIKGQVLPVTTDKSLLCAELEDGTIIEKEDNISIPKHNPELQIKKLFLKTPAKLFSECKQAIALADIIVLGPGDIYTSVLPNLLVDGLVDSIKNSKAKKVYVCNVMTKYGESTSFKASNFVNTVESYLGKNILDGVVVNSKIPSQESLDRYKIEHAELVENDLDENSGLRVVSDDLIKEPQIVRHHSKKLAEAILSNF